jgi:hypothetical protein
VDQADPRALGAFLRALATRIEDDSAFGHALLALLHESGLLESGALAPPPRTRSRRRKPTAEHTQSAAQTRRDAGGALEDAGTPTLVPSAATPSSSAASAVNSASAANSGSAPAPLDPFAELRGHGEADLRAALAELDLAALRQIVRAFRLDPARVSARWTTPERVIELIVEQVRARAGLGRAFEHV